MKIKTGKTRQNMFHLSAMITYEDSERLRKIGDGSISIGIRNLLDSVRDDIDETIKRKTPCKNTKRSTNSQSKT